MLRKEISALQCASKEACSVRKFRRVGIKERVMSNYTKFALFLLLLSGTAALASITGTISGLVTDPGGAVVPSASVKATNIQTGVEQTIVTDAKGFYSFPALAIGTYNI